MKHTVELTLVKTNANIDFSQAVFRTMRSYDTKPTLFLLDVFERKNCLILGIIGIVGNLCGELEKNTFGTIISEEEFYKLEKTDEQTKENEVFSFY